MSIKNYQIVSQQLTLSSPSQHFLEILLSLLLLIFPPPADQTLLSLSDNNWPVDWSCCSASPCYLLDVGGSQTLESLSLCMGCSLHYRSTCGVSLLTMAVISLDRLIALLSGLRYKEIVTLKRIYIIIASFWVLCLVASLCTIFDQRITALYALILVPLSLLISLASYTKIFRTLGHHQAQVQDHIQQQPSQPNTLNMARYRKAVHSALWVELALVVCYTPCYIMGIIVTYSTTYSSHLVVILQMATILVSFNSTLNLFLYCRWRLLKWDKQWSRQSDKHFAVHGVRPFSSYSWSYKYLQCKADQ